jgi:hypothetical protein
VTSVIGPGVAMQRLLRLPVDTALVLPLGLACSALASWASVASGLPWLFPALMLLAAAGLAVPAGRWSFAGPRLRHVTLPAVATIIVLAVTQYPLNRRNSSGEFVLDDLERIDTAFHVGVTWEVATGGPPQVPGLSGIPLGYHLGSYLARAAALRWAGIYPYDALYRFDVTLWALALVLAASAAARALAAPPLAAALSPWTPLLTDFSYLCVLVQPSARWWTELLGGNLLLSLVFANSLVPALAMTLGVVVALRHHAEDPRPAWLVIAGALALAVPFFKVFLGVQLLLGLLVALGLGRGPRGLWLVCVAAAAATAMLAGGAGARSVAVLFQPLAPVAEARERLGLAPAGVWGLLGSFLLWLPASLGVRIAGLPDAVRALRSRDASFLVLGTLALSGWPLALFFRISADGVFDEAVYLTLASGSALWLFAAGAVARWGRSRRAFGAAVAAAAVLSLPATVELVWRKASTRPDVVPARVLRAMDVLARESAPGDVVLCRPFSRFPPPPVVFAGRRVPFTDYLPYLRQFAPPAVVDARERRVRAFFRTKDAEEARSIARELRARFVYLVDDQALDPAVERGLLHPLYFEEGVRLYRIREAILPPRRR